MSAVKAFNRRLARSTTAPRFPESPIPTWLPSKANSSLHQEHYLVHGESGVHGGYILKLQNFMLHSKLTRIGYFSLPISEGIIDSSHAIVGMLTVKDALRRSPLLFGLGMGGVDQPIAKLLKHLKFNLTPCPFLFRVNHPYRFLRNITFLRKTLPSKALLDALAFTGLGWTALQTIQRFKDFRVASSNLTKVERIHEFDSWCNDLWERAYESYSLIAVRDQEVLQTLYPSNDTSFIKLRVSYNDTVIGWAVLRNTSMKNHRQFGNMQVGSIVDVLAIPGQEGPVVRQATEFLQQAGSDLLISNQLHQFWIRAFRKNGYLQGPSNYMLAVSPQLTSLLSPFDETRSHIHMTRGDGDGPIHL
ncbi:MAG: hypothetical protein HRU82_07270 [Nitrospira sp.]|nr:MAG: hypothetical protein HRU82_07270 [Nitrospira sp.]